ncbi:MAG: serine/threonine-protein kinase [Chloroflexota bacterium]
MLERGTQIDRYKLDKPIGTGSSGEVWLAFEGTRPFAVKFLNAHLLNTPDADKHYARFKNEIQALEILNGTPHIPALFGYNLTFERPYLAMEYIEGESWAAQIQSGEVMLLTVMQRLTLLDIIARTIGTVHSKGIIHRDIKPSNIHHTRHPFIIDFSVSIAVERARNARRDVGTSIYMQPEDDAPTDELHDNFAFALVTYEMLFGRHAVLQPVEINEGFTETRQTMKSRLANDNWRRPTTLTEGELPGSLRGADLDALDAVFAKALGNRDMRYTDLTQFMADVRGAIDIPANVTYLSYVPPVTAELPAVDEEAYTKHEVGRARVSTNHTVKPYQPVRRRRKRSWMTAGVITVIVLWVIALVLVFISVMATGNP